MMHSATNSRPTPVRDNLACVLSGLALLLLAPAATAQSDTFTVTVEAKTSAHPYAGRGFGEGYVIDGVQGKELVLVRGRTYTFQMENVASIHPFYLSTDATGAGAGEITDGVTGSMATGNGTLTFTPSDDTPDLIYYQCAIHAFMGWRIRVLSPMEATLALVADGFTHPVALAEPPDESGRLFIADQTGQVHIVMPDGTRLPEPFLDVSDRMVELNPNYDERGLLGLAFHPDYAQNGRLFVYYSAPLRGEAPDDFNHTSHVSEFTVSGGDANRADPASERVLLRVDQPQGNHNAGTLAFGPADGYLYIALGDGGNRDDEGTGHVEDWYGFNAGGNAQDLGGNLLGSLLRIDVDGGEPYGVPDDNPFVGVEGVAAEQYAYGFRNPYRFSFDMGGTNDLLVGDAGQELWEEVSRVTAGGNYGWNVYEGTHCFDAANPEATPESCPDAVGAGHPREGDPLLSPIIEVANAKQEGGLGLVVVGGYVYRGAAVPALEGQYLFGMWSRGRGDGGALPGRVLVATPAEEGLWPFQELSFTDRMDNLDDFLLSFGQDRAGEVYVLTAAEVGPTGTTGKVSRITAPGQNTSTGPEATLPERPVLGANYPNPFNPTTTIPYHVSTAGPVRLVVYDLLGRAVRTLVDAPLGPGTYAAAWDGTTAAGRAAPSGVYLYRLETAAGSATRSMTLAK